MTEISRNLRNIFFPEIPPILKIEVGIFSDKKSFLQIFENTPNFFHLNFISEKNEKNQRKFFGREIGREVGHYHAYVTLGDLLPAGNLIINVRHAYVQRVSRVCPTYVTRMSRVCHAW